MKKFLKRAALVLVALVAIALIFPAFLPRTFAVERSIRIDRPREEVFDYLARLTNQPAFSSWSKLDPDMSTRVSGKDGEVGSIYSWTSVERNVGAGELEIKGLTRPSRLDLEIRIHSPFESTDPTYILLETVDGNSTQMKQVYTGKINYPMNILCSMVCDTVGKGMDETLANLKKVLEKK